MRTLLDQIVDEFLKGEVESSIPPEVKVRVLKRVIQRLTELRKSHVID